MSSLLHSLRRVPLLLVVLAVVLSLFAPAANAAGGGDSGGSGPGGSVGGGGGSSISYACYNGEGWHRAGGRNGTPVKKLFDAPFARCADGHNAWDYTNKEQICQVGYEVFRFYSLGGTAEKPNAPQSWTRSIVGQPAWCQNTPMFYYYPHPEDAPGQPSGNAWGNNRRDTNARGQNYVTLSNGRVSTNKPWTGSSATCATLTAGAKGRPIDQLPQYFRGGAKYNTDIGRAVRKDVFESYKKWEKTAGWEVAVTAINAANRTAIPNADAIAYGDGLACSSDMDFATVINKANVIYGTCYIPLQKRAAIFEKTGNSSVKNPEYFTDSLGGTRYSLQYKNEKNVGRAVPQWRKAIEEIVKNQYGAAQTPGSHYKGIGRGSGNFGNAGAPYHSAADRDLAAKDAKAGMRCSAARAAVSGDPASSRTTVPADHVEVNVTTPNVFQVGWNPKDTDVKNVSTDANAVTLGSANFRCEVNGVLKSCGDVGGDNKPILTTLHYGLQLDGVNGYIGPQCSENRNFCDFTARAVNGTPARVDAGNGTRSRPRVDSPLTYKGQFFTATQRAKPKAPAEKVRVLLTGGTEATPRARYLMPVSTIVSYVSCTTLPAINGEVSEPECTKFEVSEQKYEERDVKVVVKHNNQNMWSSDGKYKTKEILLDTVGATGISIN